MLTHSLPVFAQNLSRSTTSGSLKFPLGSVAPFLKTMIGAPGADPVVVLSDGPWRRLFNRPTDIVGKIVHLNGSQFTVIGVMGERFPGTRVGFAPDLSVLGSMTLQMAGDLKPERNSHYIELMQRIGPARLAALQNALTACNRQWLIKHIDLTGKRRRRQTGDPSASACRARVVTAHAVSTPSRW